MTSSCTAGRGVLSARPLLIVVYYAEPSDHLEITSRTPPAGLHHSFRAAQKKGKRLCRISPKCESESDGVSAGSARQMEAAGSASWSAGRTRIRSINQTTGTVARGLVVHVASVSLPSESAERSVHGAGGGRAFTAACPRAERQDVADRKRP